MVASAAGSTQSIEQKIARLQAECKRLQELQRKLEEEYPLPPENAEPKSAAKDVVFSDLNRARIARKRYRNFRFSNNPTQE